MSIQCARASDVSPLSNQALYPVFLFIFSYLSIYNPLLFKLAMKMFEQINSWLSQRQEMKRKAELLSMHKRRDRHYFDDKKVEHADLSIIQRLQRNGFNRFRFVSKRFQTRNKQLITPSF